ncbi:MAG: hypothetical protein HYX64_05225, partial [Gammaproteobacteria bacterium]|nr:hypothetical protein [Gammaproteobacteria bacterium]
MAAQEYRAPAADADLAGNGPEAWVAHAWDIAAEGREIAAVEWLTSRNRERRSEQAERALVQLRHRAFARCESGGGRLSWPPQFDDAFPDASGVPEVMARSLTPSTLGAGIVHHGALLVRGLVDSKQAARFCDGIDRTFDACAAAMEEGQSARGPWYARFKPVPPYSVGAARNWVWQGGGVWTADSPRMVFELLEAFEGAGLRQVLSGYLGERPAMSLKKCTLRRVPVETGTDWHQDGAFLGEGIRTVNVWLALTH